MSNIYGIFEVYGIRYSLTIRTDINPLGTIKSYRILCFTLLMSCLGVSLSYSQGVEPTKGKEFWIGFMENYAVESWESLDVFITSDQATTGTLSIPQQAWSVDFSVAANVTTTVTVPNNIAEHFTNQVVEDRGVYVETQDTVSVFAINFNGYTADGTKILPVQSLGTEYRISSYGGLNETYPSEFLIVATEDDTEVEITPAVATAGGDPAGVAFTVSLNAGESYQVQATGTSDLMGSVIKGTEANGNCRPFAVFSGVSCTNIPSCFACDHIFEQNFPVDTWGEEFYIVPFDFADTYTYRVMANVDNTTISINGAAPFTLDAGEFQEYNSITTPQCVEASTGISVTQYMEGVGCAGAGDPAMLILNDASQKIDQITFSTVESDQITEHGLNVIMEATETDGLFLDGVAISSSEFTSFPNCSSHAYAQLDLTEGSHTLVAQAGFTAYVFGTGSAESYAYSVGSFSPIPPLNIDSVLCTSDTIILGIDNTFFDPYWYSVTYPDDTLSTDYTLTLTPPLTNDVFVGVGNQLISGCPEEQYFSVEVPTPPALTLSQSADTICQFNSVQLGTTVDPASSVYTYEWSPTAGLNNPNIANPVASPLETTEYSVTVSTPTGCGVNTASLTVAVTDGDISGFEAVTDIDQFCLGEEAQLDIQLEQLEFDDNFDPGISWGLWDEINNGTASDDCGSISGNALYFDGDGERSATTVAMDVSQGGTIIFGIKIGTGAFPCDNVDPGEDIVLEYSNSGGAWTLIDTYYEFAYPTMTVESASIPVGAQGASTEFRWRQLANSGAGQDNWAIDNVSIGAVNSDGYDYVWTPNIDLSSDTIANPIASPSDDQWYYVNMTDDVSGCSYQDSILLNVGQPFTLDIHPDSTLCEIQSTEIYAIPSIDGVYNYEWSPDNGTINNIYIPNPTVSPTATATYDVVVMSEEGCEDSGSVTLFINELIELNVTADETNLCAGESTQLNANVNGSNANLIFDWTPFNYLDDASISDPLASPPSDITYTVVVMDSLTGCSLTDSIALAVYQSFQLFAPEDTVACTYEGLVLEASTDAMNAVVWQWEPAQNLVGANTATPEFILEEGGDYIVSLSDGLGCEIQDTVNVEFVFQDIDLGNDADICEGESVVIESGLTSDFDHDWSTGDTGTSTEVSTSQTVSLEATSPEGCVFNDQLDVVVHGLPIVNLGPDISSCEGLNEQLDAGNAGSQFAWSTNQNTQTISVNTTGAYWVEVTDVWTCVNSDTIQVDFHINPVVDLPETFTSCEDETMTLDAGNPGATFEWSNGSDDQVITVSEPDIYSVIVTNAFNCSSTDQTEYNQLTYPVVDLGPDGLYCEGEMVSLNAGNPGMNYEWSTGADEQSITVMTTDVYSVTVDNGHCFTSDMVSIVFSPNPVEPSGTDTVVCFLDPPHFITLDAGNPGHVYSWSNGQSVRAIDVQYEGFYDVTITSPLGCSITSTFTVIEECYGGALYVPSGFTPDNDGLNDVFKAEGENIVSFRMEIWNRWGEMIYEIDDISQHWDGSVRGGNHYVEPGVYVYRVQYQVVTEEGFVSPPLEKDGHVTVVR